MGNTDTVEDQVRGDARGSVSVEAVNHAAIRRRVSRFGHIRAGEAPDRGGEYGRFWRGMLGSSAGARISGHCKTS